MTYYYGLALTLFQDRLTLLSARTPSIWYPILPINSPYDQCHKFCLNNLGNDVSIEYLKLPEQYAFASCLPGTVTEWISSFLCILYLRFVTAVKFTMMLSSSVLKQTPNDHLIFMFHPVTSMHHLGLHQRRLLCFLATYKTMWHPGCLVVVSLPLWQPQLLHPNISILHTSIHFILFHLFLYTEVSFTKRGLQDTLLAKTTLDTLGMNCINSIPIIF